MTESVSILIVAAGRGLRAGGEAPKQYRHLLGKTLLAHTLDAMAAACPDAPIYCVIDQAEEERYRRALNETAPTTKARVADWTEGGRTRQESVRSGLEAIARGPRRPSHVLIHDAARPFIDKNLIDRAFTALRASPACAPGAPVPDTIKRIGSDSIVVETPKRADLRAIQTPQAFAFDLILDAHRRIAAAGIADCSDDAAVAEALGAPVRIFEGDGANFKITSQEDFQLAERKIDGLLSDIRTGQGYDVHAFVPGRSVRLGGVDIAHDKSLAGHSDADVLIHAIADALFGALADGDIGAHFPPSDMQWKNARSEVFLRFAMERLRARGGVLANVDGTIVCEAPKIGPHREAIRSRLAEIMNVDVDRVAIKATTSERLGFTGREEGVAAMAIATVRLPGRPQRAASS